jgi:Zn-dependent peptidase ImmA (M78 family)
VRRGFKRDSREIAAQIRTELGLTAHHALDPLRLAEHLEIPVWPISSFQADLPKATGILLSDTGTTVSGVLAFDGHRRVIIHNDAHALTRQRSTIAHELAHALLLHEPIAVTQGAPLKFDRDQEEEATWLGGVLLVTDDFCVRCARDQVTLQVAADQMGVSLRLMRWRYNMSGAERRISKAGFS